MTRKIVSCRVAGTALAIALTTMWASQASAATYYIDEGTDFTGNGCEISDVNTITSSLQTALNSASWTGSRYVNSLAFPSDYFEHCSSNYGSSGNDSAFADGGFLSVYAGHGAAHLLAFGYPHNSACSVNFTNNMRLGEMDGHAAGFGMWLACEVIQGAELGTAMYQRLRQQASWQNTINIGDDEPRDFFNATSTKTNADAWIDQMSSGGRDAIISTFSNSSVADCTSVHNAAKLKGNVYNTPLGTSVSCNTGGPIYYYCYEHFQG